MDIATLGLEVRSDGVVVATDRLDKFDQQAKKTDVATKGLNVTLLALGAAVAAAVGAMALGVRAAINQADSMAKLSQSVGVSVERLSALSHAANLAGVDVNSLATTLGFLNRNMADTARGGTSGAAQAFKALGVSVVDANGRLRDNLDVMGDVADRFANMRDGAQKSALAVEIFGRSGRQMIPLLNAGSAGLREMMEEAERLGLVIETRTAKAAEEFNDNLTRIDAAGKGFMNTLMSLLLPSLVAVSGAMVALVMAGDQMLDMVSTIAPYAAVAVAALAGFYAPMMLAGIGSLTVALGTGLVGAIKAVTAAMMANPLGLLIAGIAAAVTAAFVFRDEIKQAIGVDVVGVVKDAANSFIGFFVGAYNAVTATWDMLPSAIGDAVYSAAEGAINGVIYMIRGVQAEINGLLTDLNGMMSKMGSSLQFDQIGLSSYVDLGNPFAGAAGKAGETASGAFGDAMGQDYIGAMAAGLGEMWDNATGALGALSDLGGEIDGNLAPSLAAASEASDPFKQMLADMAPLIEGQIDPLQRLQQQMDTLGALLAAGKIDWEQYGIAAERAQLLAASATFGAVGQITGALSQMFKDNKALAVANAVINTAEGVTKAWAQGGMFGGIAAAAIAASGAAQIAAIMSAQPGGASRPNVNGGASTAAQQAPQQAPRSVYINLQGDNYSGQSVGNLLEQLQDQLGIDGLQLVVTHKQA